MSVVGVTGTLISLPPVHEWTGPGGECGRVKESGLGLRSFDERKETEKKKKEGREGESKERKVKKGEGRKEGQKRRKGKGKPTRISVTFSSLTPNLPTPISFLHPSPPLPSLLFLE